jgi:hypothetical protein
LTEEKPSVADNYLDEKYRKEIKRMPIETNKDANGRTIQKSDEVLMAN